MTFYFFMQLREWITKHRGLSLGIGSIGLLGVILLFIWSRQSVTPSIEGVQTTVMVTTTQIEETTTSESLYYVDIKGAVKNPGVYQLPPESRVQEAIVQAGGITEEGDQEQVNLAQKISDQMVIHVPKKGEAPLIIGTGSATNASDPATHPVVHLNRASLEELETLTGVGKKKAEAILQYRTEHGGFKNIEELQNVKGIGPKAFEKLKDQVAL